MKEYIVYLRSWPKKSRSSVDIATQKEEAARFVSFGAGEGPGRIVGEYTDRETHRRGERPELAKAIEHAIRAEATLVIVHLGRLGRNVPVTRMLLDSQVEFRCLDRQEVNPKTIHVVANMAEEETRKVSDRSKAALAAARARGVKLGSHDPRVRKANLPEGNLQGDQGGGGEKEGGHPQRLRLHDARDQGPAGTGRDAARDRRMAEQPELYHDGRQALHPDRRVAADRPLPGQGVLGQHEEEDDGLQGGHQRASGSILSTFIILDTIVFG